MDLKNTDETTDETLQGSSLGVFIVISRSSLGHIMLIYASYYMSHICLSSALPLSYISPECQKIGIPVIQYKLQQLIEVIKNAIIRCDLLNILICSYDIVRMKVRFERCLSVH